MKCGRYARFINVATSTTFDMSMPFMRLTTAIVHELSSPSTNGAGELIRISGCIAAFIKALVTSIGRSLVDY